MGILLQKLFLITFITFNCAMVQAQNARPLYSPDGRQIAFISTRTGNGDIYLVTLSTDFSWV